MSISFTRYVDIVSGVSGSAGVATRQFIGRLFTTNPLLPAASFIEFDTAADVGTYFGFTSAEYLRALFYFTFVSKQIAQPKKISFSRWISAGVAPVIFGGPNVPVLATLNAITAGAFTLVMGPTSHTFTGLNFGSAGSFAAVATVLQTAIQGITAGGALWTAATVSYDATRACFDLTGGVAGAAVISITDGASTPAAALGWTVATGAIFGPGAAVETITQTLTESDAASDNFGSFDFIPVLNESQVVEAATWNAGLNVKYIFCQEVQVADATTWSAAVIGLAGCALILAPLAAEYPEMEPMMILAATDYTRRNASQNYMYQEFALTPSVTTDAGANTYDPLRVNYYGQTQTAGQQISFFQRGILMGGPTAPLDMNVYANEMWFKDAAGAAIMAAFLALTEIPANAQGRAQLITVLQSVIAQAIFNGTISVGKTLTALQQIAVTDATGDPNAWRQVQNTGWWLDVVIVQITGPDNTPEEQAQYTLVYSKNDAVRKVQGSHILI